MKKKKMNFLRKIFRKRKKVLSVLLFYILLFSLPISSYLVTNEESFDRRTEARVFNSLVAEKEEFLEGLEGDLDYEPGVIRLEFPEDVSNEEIERIIGGKRTTPEELLDTPFERVEYIEVDENNMSWEMAKYERYFPTESVDLNYLVELSWRKDGEKRVLPNDWQPAHHWYFNNIKLPETWKLQGCLEGKKDCGGSKDVVVMVLDTGMAFGASDVRGMNFFSHPTYNRAIHSDRAGHGTMMASIIAASTNNSHGTVGVAHNVTIMPYNAGHLNYNAVDLRKAEPGVYYGVKYGVDIINMSFGRGCASPSPSYFINALNYATRHGVVLVAASGNLGQSCIGYPAGLSNVISVGAVNPDNSRWRGSNYGHNLDFVAPMPALVQDHRGRFSRPFGTSASAPQVAGAAALVLSMDPSLNPRQVKDILVKTATDIGPKGKDPQTGYGLINLENIYKYMSVLQEMKFTVKPAQIKYGEEATLEWSSPDATNCRASGGWRGDKEKEGTEVVSPSRTTTYTLTCFAGDRKRERSVTLEVEPIELEFTTSSELVEPGESFTLQWKSSGVSSCEASGSWSGEKELSGSEKITPVRMGNYILTCYQMDKDVKKSVEVRVNQCQSVSDCRPEAPYEICFKNSCLRGDVLKNGEISFNDFETLKKDFLEYKKNGWNLEMRRSDLNGDFRLSMADYSVFVNSYRIVKELE